MAASLAHAEDGRVEKAKKIRDEILLKRRDAAPLPTARPQHEDPFQAQVAAARERLAAIDAQIEEKRRHNESLAAPRQKLDAKNEELTAQVAKMEEQNRGRVEAIYRSAKLGAGAAGWHPDPARSARLSRYLAAVAAVQQQRLEVVEVEQGSVLASLDHARAEDETARNELKVLDTDRTEAQAALDRAMAEAGVPRAPSVSPAEAEAEAIAQEQAEDESKLRESGFADAQRLAEEQAFEAAANHGSPPTMHGAGGAAGAGGESSEAIQRALALLEAKKGIKGAGSAPGAAPAAPNGENGDFQWPASVAADSAQNVAGAATNADADRAAADLKLAEAKAAVEAKAREAKLAAEAKAEADAKAAAEAKKLAGAAAKAEAETKAEAEAKAAADAKAVELARAKTKPDDGEPAELEDGPSVLAPSTPAAGGEVASVPPAQPGGEAPTTADAEKAKRPNLFSRFFGADRESDAFAASRGNLPPPVSGKVVANYGQQHKSGATYRGVILRAGHNAPIKAVAGGKVSFVGNVPGLGNTVIVSHGGRYHTVYARLGSLEVKEGQTVRGGTEVGTLPDDNGDMHFELRDEGKAVDPVPWLKGGIPGAPAQ